MTHYCVIFNFGCVIQKVNVLGDTDATRMAIALCNMLCDKNVACVVTALALCLKKKKKVCHPTKELYKQRP